MATHDAAASVSEEAARLVEALRARRAPAAAPEQATEEVTEPVDEARGTDRPGPETSSPQDHDQHAGGSECSRCPVCLGLRAVRSISPTTLDSLADVLSMGVEALRDLAADGRRRTPDTPTHQDQTPTPGASS